MKVKYLLFSLIVFIIVFNCNAQEIRIIASNKPLNQVLIEIRDNYQAQFSFDDAELSKYRVNLSKSFTSIDKALEYLLKDFPFEYEKVSGVYIILPKKIEIPIEVKPKSYFISGRILEYRTNEFLPYTFLQINSHGIMSDQNGNFHYRTEKDSVFKIRISQLGYVIKDTVVYAGMNNANIYLTPSDQLISEIMVKDNVLETFINAGNEPATIKLNHKVTKYLPGSSDNSVFNLLRLQPGILASGEQANEVIIWGSYAGQSRVVFDEFTVFGLKNFNDNISAINPLITKNILLKKAGYDASYGDCIGGIVNITGKEGNTQKPHFETGINNFTFNSLLEIPILKKSSLQLAYRQTYYNLYKDGLNLFPRADSSSVLKLADIYIYPDYAFRDYNIKYSIKTDNQLFYVSFLNSNDNFNYSFNKIRKYREITKSTHEKNHQSGASVFYESKINSNLSSRLILSYSGLSDELKDDYQIYSTITNRLVNQRSLIRKNEIREIKGNLQTVFQTKKNQSIEVDLQVLNNYTRLSEDSTNIPVADLRNDQTYYTVGIKDIVNFRDKNLNLGLRASYLPYLEKVFIEPRISYSQTIHEKFKFNLAWGIYHQFLVKSTIIDDLGNYRYFWTIADDQTIPVLNAYHYVAGFSFTGKKVSLNFDAFYKTTDGVTRYIRISQLNMEDIYSGNAKNYGFDLYTKYNFGKHTIWLSYSLSKSLEHFNYFISDDYLYAPQDQRHEIKLASIINLNPVFVSANYIYGSGFLEKPFRQRAFSERIPYSRLDMSVTYKFTKIKNVVECGLSVLNVLNTENKKYSNFEKLPVSQTNTVDIYYEAVPFTPTLFLKISI